MLQLQGLWQTQIPEQGVAPDTEQQLYWVRRASESAAKGSDVWFEAHFRLASYLQWKDPKQARQISNMLYEQAPDAVVRVKALYWLQSIARAQNELVEAERICHQLMAWTRDHRDELPEEMLRKGEIFSWIQNSAGSLMSAWANESGVPYDERIKKINSFAERYAGNKYFDRVRDRALANIEKRRTAVPMVQPTE
jgi:hypothetical protein